MSIIMLKAYDKYKRAALRGVVTIRYVAGITLILFYLGFFGIFGFFFLGLNGEIYSVAFALCSLTITLLLGDRIFLVLIRAKAIEPKNQKILYSLQNLSCLQGVGEVRVYVSFLIPANAYCIHPFFGDPCLIFSKEVIEQADDDVIENSMEKALRSFSSKRLRFAHMVTLLVSLLFLPKYWLDKVHLGFLAVVYSYLFFPVVFIKDFMLAVSQTSAFTDQAKHSVELRAIYFLERFPESSGGFLSSLAEDFSLYPKRKMSLWPSLLGDHNSITNSYLKLHERKV